VAGGRAARGRLGLRLVIPGRVCVRRPIVLCVFGGQRLGDVLELLPLGLDTEQQLGDAAQRHDHGAYEPNRHLALVAGCDQLARRQRSGDSADGGADREEEGDRQRPGLIGTISEAVRYQPARRVGHEAAKLALAYVIRRDFEAKATEIGSGSIRRLQC
jgi:hypothetical protein